MQTAMQQPETLLNALRHYQKTEKPWGGFIQYVLNQPVTVKILEIRAGEQVSYQYHHHRR